MVKGISVLGSTGSIGTSTLDTLRRFPDRFRLVGLGAGKNLDLLCSQIEEFRPAVVSLTEPSDVDCLARRLEGRGEPVPELFSGEAGLEAVATHADVEEVVVGVVGTGALVPLIEALKKGKQVALASKECLVAGGELVYSASRAYSDLIIPVDSEMSAIYQCLRGESPENVKSLTLTASGGPFKDFNREQLQRVTREEALAHPVWKMGGRITIDSATLMNKGFEVIESHWLFDVAFEDIGVVVHPEGIIHSLATFKDGSSKAQLSSPDMRLPIMYALSYPERFNCPFAGLNVDLPALQTLTFYEPDRELFPCLDLAFRAGKAGGTLPAVLNAADETAVGAFLKGMIRFVDIPEILQRCMEIYENVPCTSLDAIRNAEIWARETAGRFCHESRYRI